MKVVKVVKEIKAVEDVLFLPDDLYDDLANIHQKRMYEMDPHLSCDPRDRERHFLNEIRLKSNHGETWYTVKPERELKDAKLAPGD